MGTKLARRQSNLVRMLRDAHNTSGLTLQEAARKAHVESGRLERLLQGKRVPFTRDEFVRVLYAAWGLGACEVESLLETAGMPTLITRRRRRAK